jgi:hypothetical protein
MLGLNEQALNLLQENLKGVRNIINDINDKPQNLRQFIHPQWGSILGSEDDVRCAVLKDELEIWEQRMGNDSDFIPYLKYIKDTLQSRIEELSPNKPLTKTTQVDEGNYEYMPKKPEGEWTKIREHERMANYVDESSLH